MCIFPDCKTRPLYNVDGQTKAVYCSEHKLNGMVDVIHKRCKHEGCKTRPNFNIIGKKQGLYCSAHKKDGMVDVINKTCIHPDCEKQPTCNIKGKKQGLYCSVHKLDGMVDVTNKRCIHEGCETRPTYNVEGEITALYCFIHKLDGMMDVRHSRCIYEGCKTRPNFNIEEETKGLYCSIHKLDGMVNVVAKTCKTHLCYTFVSEKYDGYCLFCYINIFPDKPVSRNYKTKEFAVVEFVKTNHPDLTWIADKSISDGCSRRRPDLLLDLGYQIIIIEIDENQHIDYDCSCENKRIMELSQDAGHRPIVFIRFNPDEYTENETYITSCWGINKKGICVVKKSKKEEWNDRLQALTQQINYWIDPNNKTNKTIETRQLFYDK